MVNKIEPIIVRRSVNHSSALYIEFSIPIPAVNDLSSFVNDHPMHNEIQNIITLIYGMMYNGVSAFEIQQRLLTSPSECE